MLSCIFLFQPPCSAVLGFTRPLHDLPMSGSVQTPSSSNIKPDASGSSVPKEHPIASEYREWELRIFAAQPKAPPDLDLTVHNATQHACRKAYEAEAAAAMKDVIEEYNKWRAEHESELWEWFKSCGEDEEPDF
ncbi:hypothetical protein EV421DRAFT_793933 [Armillaria borealis]|uniref:Uncharacterized protein n=1 Tax=Armillaria borealis TaxID=47425 RepID=A0AA39JCN1_9AGAR|nr:hypothetical protein EV421DRAFT_793933 [Armillaria borealis]